ncbi:MAG: leader peptidase (prepilin peptidase)/N-methyltransferase [Myxococcota bacterium]|jgi:leader peptidase (prepilin peptidase)/N-methyltransferase
MPDAAGAIAAQMYVVYSVFALVFGLLVGSFLNVCIARMPEDRSVVSPPSHCPSCGHGIRPYDNIPVVSWVLLRGKCRDCGAKISSLYPTVELLTGLLAWLLFRRILPDPSHLTLANGAGFVFTFSIAAMLLAQSYIDLKHYIIPDEFSIYAVPYAVAAAVGLTWLGYDGALSWRASVLGAFFGGGLLFAVATFWKLVRRIDAMGMGDVKLLALIGAALGPWPALPFVIFGSVFLALFIALPIGWLATKKFNFALPFGPFLGLASIIWMLHGPELVARYYPGVEQVSQMFFGM